MAVAVRKQFDVGGVQFDRPFKVRRLGHFGVNVADCAPSLRFYSDLLGFRVSDTLDYAPRLEPEEAASLGGSLGYFMRHGTDHHSFVIFRKGPAEAVRRRRGEAPPEGVTINQITWQVGSLREIAQAKDWLPAEGWRISRVGRDVPGSNWHVYMPDPDQHINELYYGIEQIGWQGSSKPGKAHEREFKDLPPLPHASEFDEVQQALARGVELSSGHRHLETLPAIYDVGGILLPRPFKVVRIGPVALFVKDVNEAERFYAGALGLRVSERTTWNGHECVFLRCNTEHHTLALYPLAMRADLVELDQGKTLASFGLQLGSYRQLRDAVTFLKDHGCSVTELPSEIHPGIDYAAYVKDPDGHAIQLYYYMEQLGWDGKPRPASLRPRIEAGSWPELVPDLGDTYGGEQFLGPVG